VNLFGPLAQSMPLRLQMSADHGVEAVEEAVLQGEQGRVKLRSSSEAE
jgi:hypothetical protein